MISIELMNTEKQSARTNTNTNLYVKIKYNGENNNNNNNDSVLLQYRAIVFGIALVTLVTHLKLQMQQYKRCKTLGETMKSRRSADMHYLEIC